MGWVSSSQNLHWSPPPSTCECDLIWEHSLCRCIQIKRRSLGWVLIQYVWCPHKKRTHGHTQGRVLCENRGRVELRSCKQGMTSTAINTGSSERGMEKISLKAMALWHVVFYSWPLGLLNYERIYFWFRLPSMWYFVLGVPGNEHCKTY